MFVSFVVESLGKNFSNKNVILLAGVFIVLYCIMTRFLQANQLKKLSQVNTTPRKAPYAQHCEHTYDEIIKVLYGDNF